MFLSLVLIVTYKSSETWSVICKEHSNFRKYSGMLDKLAFPTVGFSTRWNGISKKISRKLLPLFKRWETTIENNRHAALKTSHMSSNTQ